MILHIDLDTYGYAYEDGIYEVLHYYKLSVKTGENTYMQLREHYGYQDLSLYKSAIDQILCQLINLNYTYSILLELLKTEEYDELEIGIMWGGKPKRAKAVVESPYSNYTTDAKKQAVLYKVRQQQKKISEYIPLAKIREANARDLLGNRNVKRDGYKFNRAVGLTVNKMPNGRKFNSDIIDEFDLYDLLSKDHIRITDFTKRERAKRRRERLRGKGLSSSSKKNGTKKVRDQKQKAIQLGNEVMRREAKEKGIYNYLSEYQEEEKIWIKSCYKYILNMFLNDDTSEIKLLNTIGADLSSLEGIEKELYRLENEDTISIDLDNSYLKLVDEFSEDTEGEENKITFKEFIDEYDGYDLFI